MNADKGSLWVRYLGGTVMHLFAVFPIPTATVPERVANLRGRGDIAEVWYLADYTGGEFERSRAHREV